MNFTNVFFNDTGRIRSGWRFLIFQLLFVLLGMPAGLGIVFLLQKLNVNFAEKTLAGFIIPFFIFLLMSVFFGWLCGKLLEALPFRALGLWFTKNWFKDLLCGLGIGTGALLFAVLIAVLFGSLRFHPNESNGTSAILSTLGTSLAVFVVGAIAEEAYFRGYILQTFARANLAWAAIIFTALFFAFGHLGNTGADWISSINTGLAGIWFGVAYLKTRTLWFPFGIHFAWNWVQGAILGIPVSGIKEIATAPVFVPSDYGMRIFTGGEYGIEGGIACTIALVAATALIWYLPIFKPSEEMLALTSRENPKTLKSSES